MRVVVESVEPDGPTRSLVFAHGEDDPEHKVAFHVPRGDGDKILMEIASGREVVADLDVPPPSRKGPRMDRKKVN